MEPAAWILGEDSGLEVEGLEGRPGVQSARFAAGEHVARLLAELEGVEGEGRRARYVCELVAVSPEGEELRGTGILEGRIAVEPRGTEGFGFDPIFVPDGEERTVCRAGRRVEGRELPPRARGEGPQASPGTASRSSSRSRASHQLTSAPKTIAFAIR